MKDRAALKKSDVQRVVWYHLGLLRAGGGERLLLEGLKYFTERGMDAALFTQGYPVEEEAFFNGTYQPRVLRSDLKIHDISVFSINAGRKIRNMFLLMRSLLEFNPDIIIANGQSVALRAWGLSFIPGRKKMPCICFIHGSFFQFSDEGEKYAWIFRKNFEVIRNGDPVYRELIAAHAPASSPWSKIRLEIGAAMRFVAVKRAEAVFVLTNKAKKEIELLYGHSNVRVLHGAFPENLLRAKMNVDKRAELGVEGKVVILSLCRLVDKKRVDVLVKAFSLYAQENPDAVLLIGGIGPELHNLEQLAAECRVADKVRFLGFVCEEELNDYYFCCDVFASADNADYDITSIVALALGKRVVASVQHEFDPALFSLNLLFHADPTPEGFAKSFADAVAIRVGCDQAKKEEVMREYSWEYYFSNVVAVMNEIHS